MFDGADFPKSLDENIFHSWLENGRLSKIQYRFLLIIWNELDEAYQPVYVEHRDQINEYEKYGRSSGSESLVAVYDLYSESRVL